MHAFLNQVIAKHDISNLNSSASAVASRYCSEIPVATGVLQRSGYCGREAAHVSFRGEHMLASVGSTCVLLRGAKILHALSTLELLRCQKFQKKKTIVFKCIVHQEQMSLGSPLFPTQTTLRRLRMLLSTTTSTTQGRTQAYILHLTRFRRLNSIFFNKIEQYHNFLVTDGFRAEKKNPWWQVKVHPLIVRYVQTWRIICRQVIVTAHHIGLDSFIRSQPHTGWTALINWV